MMRDTDGLVGELLETGYCVLPGHFPTAAVEACRVATWPVLLAHIARNEPNRGPHRHHVPMPFDRPSFQPLFFFDDEVLRIVRGAMDDRVVADQWGCDVPLEGSTHQGVHADFARPLFQEAPDLVLPPCFLAVSFGLRRITAADGPIEIARGTHVMPRADALRAVESGEIGLDRLTLEVGDVLIRHPWALHRGSPNTTPEPRALVTIRYVRRWYADDSREVRAIPQVPSLCRASPPGRSDDPAARCVRPDSRLPSASPAGHVCAPGLGGRKIRWPSRRGGGSR